MGPDTFYKDTPNIIDSRINSLLRRLMIAVFVFLVVFTPGCFSSSLKKQQRQVENAQEQTAKKNQKLYDKAIKDHNKKQSKETRKMMKKTKKKAKKFNKHIDRRFFLWRWLNL